MDLSTGPKYLLTAAPQCPFPDVADEVMLNTVAFDAVFVQFYNNPSCSSPSFTPGTAPQESFNFGKWDDWAREKAVNKNVKVFLGIPGSTTAAGSGYVNGAELAAVLAYCKTFGRFGGVMVWDITQVEANVGFLGEVVNGLGGNSTSSVISTVAFTATSVATSIATSIRPTTSPGTIKQYERCGGRDYHGDATCAAPYSCQRFSDWWSQCG